MEAHLQSVHRITVSTPQLVLLLHIDSDPEGQSVGDLLQHSSMGREAFDVAIGPMLGATDEAATPPLLQGPAGRAVAGMAVEMGGIFGGHIVSFCASICYSHCCC